MERTKSPNPANYSSLEDKVFLLLLALISLAFVLLLRPFGGAILWGVILAIVFAPLNRRLCENMRQRRTLAALATEIIILVMVILPLMLVVASLVQEGTGVYRRFESGELNFGRYFQRVFDSLPAWAHHLLERFDLNNLGDVPAKVAAALTKAGQFLFAQAVNLGQNTFSFVISLFVMLYLLFFLLRDGDRLALRIREAIPLRAEQQNALSNRFTAVIRATIKGNIVIALLQGTLGGIIFWILGIRAVLLCGAVMALLSLLPAVGAALVWVPAAIYFLVTGSVWRGVILFAYGIFVIGMADNVLRPILVGKNIQMPNYLVLISTLGGIAVFGINGFVIGPLIAAMFLALWDIFSPPK
jgi:predicted PurR-regulated permease PerM